MPISLDSFDPEQLSVAERLALIEKLWESLPKDLPPEAVPDWHRAELAKRRAQAAAEPGVGKPWREVLDPLEGTPHRPHEADRR